jgi:hypothetical protein
MDQYTLLTMIITGTQITFFMGMDKIGRCTKEPKKSPKPYTKEPYTNVKAPHVFHKREKRVPQHTQL